MPPGEEASTTTPKERQESALIAAARLEALGHRNNALTGTHGSTPDFSGVPWDAESFPGYIITRELHRGGQGVVYQAYHKATRRKVAVKVMREGPFASAAGRIRFEREMHVLAQMDDPHIVGIHDGGQANGFHYFVMDYVAGQPLDLHVSGMAGSVRDVVRLFQKVCSAVNAAHVRGVIHRDLKPGNILVDAQGEPRIVDFGLAKLIHEGGIDEANPEMTSITGQFIGSLPWASPEQAEGLPEKIDMRTDVYSLGVVLYQLLTREFPYSVAGRMREVLENIQHAEPAPPRSIRRELDDEIETIVLKCLAKERERRYQTAGELARDLGRYLAHEPIEAKRDSGFYILRKTLRRYRTQVAVLSLFVLLMAGSGVAMTVIFARAASAERTAHRVQAFLSDTLVGADPEEAEAADMTVLAAMERAAGRVDADLSAEPEVAAAIHYLMGIIYRSRDNRAQARHHIERSLELRRGLWGERNAESADSLHALASLYYAEGDLDTAERLYREAYATRRALFGERHEKIADSLNHLAAVAMMRRDFPLAEERFRESLTMRRDLAGADLQVARTTNNLAKCLREQNRFDEAEKYYRESVVIFQKLFGTDSMRTAKVQGSLGGCLVDAGRLEEAEPLLLEALRTKEKFAGPDDASTARTVFDLARLYASRNPPDLVRAKELAERALTVFRQRFPTGNREIAETESLLADIVNRQQRLSLTPP